MLEVLTEFQIQSYVSFSEMKEVPKHMMCTMMLPLRTVNFCYGLAIAFCNNPCWIAMSRTGYAYAQLIQRDILALLNLV